MCSKGKMQVDTVPYRVCYINIRTFYTKAHTLRDYSKPLSSAKLLVLCYYFAMLVFDYAVKQIGLCDAGMTTHGGTDRATGQRLPAGRLAELDCSKSTVCQQNRLRALLQVRLNQLERDRQATLARITRDQRQFQQRYVPKLDRSTSVTRHTSCLHDDRVDKHEDDDRQGETSKCPCDCCRYGLWKWNGKNTRRQHSGDSF